LKNLARGRLARKSWSGCGLVTRRGPKKAVDGEGVKAFSRLAEKNPRKAKLKRGSGGSVG